MTARYRFHAMGTDVECLLDGDPGGRFESVEAEFARLEATLSRFRPDSELSRLNAAGELRAGEDLLALTGLALDARRRTAGLFDPTVHAAVLAAGYDRTYEELADSGPPGAAPACGGDVEIAGGRIRLAVGVGLDLGGIAKGYAVDRAVALLAPAGPCLVNAGGDLAVSGGSWPVAVEGAGLTLELGGGGALATSGRTRRRWRRGGREQHHLIDPATGRPAQTELLQATVVAPTAAEAEVLAKVAFLTGSAGVPHVLVTAGGRTILGGGLR